MNGLSSPHLHIDTAMLDRDYDREPFAIQHDLSQSSLFGEERLRALLHRFAGHPEDYYVASGAPTPGTVFFSVPQAPEEPLAAFERLKEVPHRILLKRPENHDPEFRMLLRALFDEVTASQGGLRNGERLVRLESGLFMTSGRTVTPFHFDPEINFFTQIEGEKEYHVYSPKAVKDHELERFYVHGRLQIGQIDLASRDPSLENVFLLRPGEGLHQPCNAPHWVETGPKPSISYAFVYETERTRAAGRAMGFNHYLRRAGLRPAHDGGAGDALKAASMRLITPARRGAIGVRDGLRRLRHSA